jgi:hypothetical protein
MPQTHPESIGISTGANQYAGAFGRLLAVAGNI